MSSLSMNFLDDESTNPDSFPAATNVVGSLTKELMDPHVVFKVREVALNGSTEFSVENEEGHIVMRSAGSWYRFVERIGAGPDVRIEMIVNNHSVGSREVQIRVMKLSYSGKEVAVDGTGEAVQAAEGPVRVDMSMKLEGGHIIDIPMHGICDVVVQGQPDVDGASLFSKGFNYMKTKIISKGLYVLEGLGSEKLTKLALAYTGQMTGCLAAAYFTNSNGHLPTSLLYSAAAANTVAFLCSCGGFALRQNEPRAASIIGGIGTVFAAATFMMVMGAFIPNN